MMGRHGRSARRRFIQSSDFDGSTAYLTRGAVPTGLADSKTGTVSWWFRLDGGDGVFQHFFSNATGRFKGWRETDNKVYIQLYLDVVTLLEQTVSTSTFTAGATWHHVIYAFDLGNGVAPLYIDGADETNNSTLTDNTPDLADTDFGIGALTNGDNPFNGCLAEFWFTTAYIDITAAANRALFRTASGKPAFLGADGSRPTGTSPLVYLRHPYTQFGVNSGTGGNFTVNGSLTQGSTVP